MKFPLTDEVVDRTVHAADAWDFDLDSAPLEDWVLLWLIPREAKTLDDGFWSPGIRHSESGPWLWRFDQRPIPEDFSVAAWVAIAGPSIDKSCDGTFDLFVHSVDSWNRERVSGEYVWVDGDRYRRLMGPAYEQHYEAVVLVEDEGPLPLHRLSKTKPVAAG